MNRLQLALLGRVKPIDEIIEGIEAVTVDDVQRVAHEMLAPEGLRFAVISPEAEGVAKHIEEIVMTKEKK
jgi:predicted Zn-dependent peptidase